MKNAQCHSLLEKCRSKLQWDITSHQSERLSSKSLQTINAGDVVEKREHSCTVGGNVNWYSHYGRQYGNSLKSRNKTTIWPSNPTPRHIPWANQNWKRHMYSIVYMNHNFFTHSPTDGHLAYFHVLAVVLLWTLEYNCIFQFQFPQCVCPAVGLLGCMAVLFPVFKGISTLFP